MQNRITDCLALDESIIWTLDFTENSCLKYNNNNNNNNHLKASFPGQPG